eukprot:6313166-Pyramimonas_sp.AAC.1
MAMYGFGEGDGGSEETDDRWTRGRQMDAGARSSTRGPRGSIDSGQCETRASQDPAGSCAQAQ